MSRITDAFTTDVSTQQQCRASVQVCGREREESKPVARRSGEECHREVVPVTGFVVFISIHSNTMPSPSQHPFWRAVSIALADHVKRCRVSTWIPGIKLSDCLFQNWKYLLRSPIMCVLMVFAIMRFSSIYCNNKVNSQECMLLETIQATTILCSPLWVFHSVAVLKQSQFRCIRHHLTQPIVNILKKINISEQQHKIVEFWGLC